MPDPTHDLAAFLTTSPTPYHAVARAVARLSAAGFTEQVETQPWSREPGGRYLVRDGTLLAWWQRGSTAPLRIFAAHTDSPTLKVKPHPDAGAAGWRQVAVEVYGGALWNSWLDRDLGLAGRLARYDGSTALVDVRRPLLRVPQLAIHLDRAVNQGLTLDPQQHLLPVWGLGEPGGFLEFVAAEAGVDVDDVAAHDLVVHDLTPPASLGRDRELFAAPRLDNLVSVHAGLSALLAAGESASVPVLVAFDHEEVGSASATGAAGPLLETVLTRLAGGFDARAEVFAASRALSVDVTHAAHPNYLGHHDPGHRAVPNGGPALKVNANQRYATDGRARRRGAGRAGTRGAEPGVRLTQHGAVREHGGADHRDAAGDPDGGRRDPGALDALGAGAVRGGRPGVPRGGGEGVLRDAG